MYPSHRLYCVLLIAASQACVADSPSTPEPPSTGGQGAIDDTGQPEGDAGQTTTDGAGEGESGNSTAGHGDRDDTGSDGGSSTPTTGGVSSDGTEDGSDEGAASSAPVILSLLTNTDEMLLDTNLIISAVITDPDGVDDVIGGQLTSADGAQAFGSFQTADSEGAYQLTLTWSQLDEVETIDFIGGHTWTFVAEFYDQAGSSTAAELEVTSPCQAGCAGYCALGECHPLFNPCGEGQRCFAVGGEAGMVIRECVASPAGDDALGEFCQEHEDCQGDMLCSYLVVGEGYRCSAPCPETEGSACGWTYSSEACE